MRPPDDLDFTVESPVFGPMNVPLLMAVTAVTYLALARIASLWDANTAGPPSFWPAAGVGIGVALHVTRRKRKFVLAAIVAAAWIDAAVFVDLTPWQTVVRLLATAGGFGVAMLLIQRVFANHRPLGFDSRSTAVVSAMFLAAAVGGVIVVVGLRVDAPWTVWRTWTLGVGLGYATVGGLIMTLHRPNSAAGRAQAFGDPRRLMIALGTLAALSIAAFSTIGPAVFLVIGVALLVSARFGTWIAGPMSVAIVALASVRTSHGAGPFARFPDSTLHVQVFGVVLISSTLLVGRHDWNAVSRARREQALLALLPDEVTTHRPDGTLIGHLAADPGNDPAGLQALTDRWPDLDSTALPASLVYDVAGDRVRHIEARLIHADAGTVICLRRDMSEEFELMRRLERANADWQRLASTAYEGFVEIDRDRRVVYASDRWAEMYGRGPEDVLGHSLDEFFSAATSAHVAAATAGAPNATTTTFEYPYVRPDGSQMWVLVSLDARYDSHGFAGAVAFAADTSELHTALASRDVAELRLATLERRERERIAQFLHDGPLQTLVALSYRLNAIKDADWTETDASQLERMTLDAIHDMRDGLEELTPADVTDGRVGRALMAATSRFRTPAAPTIEFDDAIVGPVDVDVATTLYLIGREALINSILHARATVITVTITDDARGYRLEVVDDGVGFDHDLAASPGHLGMRSMRQRAQDVGGTCDVTSIEPSGTRVIVSIPRSVAAAFEPSSGSEPRARAAL